jgi:Importin-beta N-terminal domain
MRIIGISQHHKAQIVLTQFQEHPDSWQRVPKIMSESQNPQTKVSSSSKFLLLSFPRF